MMKTTKPKSAPKNQLATVSRAPSPAVVTPKDWANAEGRHGLDAYFEDQMTLRAQGVDVQSDQSCRAYVMEEGTPNERIEVLGSRDNVARVGAALQRGAAILGRPVVRPNEEMLGDLMMNAPLPVFAPLPHQPLKLQAHGAPEETSHNVKAPKRARAKNVGPSKR